MVAPNKPKVDWELVERDWRANILTITEMANKHGVSRPAITKHFKKRGIERDLGKKIEFARNSKVASKGVSSKVASKEIQTEKEIVELNATMQADIILAHRDDINKQRQLLNKLLGEIEAITNNKELFEALADSVFQDIEGGDSKEIQAAARRKEAIMRVLDLSTRVDSAKKIADTLRTLVSLERQAFGIRDDASGENEVDDFIAGMAE